MEKINKQRIKSDKNRFQTTSKRLNKNSKRNIIKNYIYLNIDSI